MGDLIHMRRHAVARAALAGEVESPWLRPDPGDWDPCDGCLIRGACREVRECHGDTDTPDIVA
jgi:hypothetical protein